MPRVARGRAARSTRTPTVYNLQGHVIETYNHIDDLPILSAHPKKRPRHATRRAAAAERKAGLQPPTRNSVSPQPPSTSVIPNVACRVCLKSNTARKIILCSICRKGIHTFCLNPPLIDLPTDSAWKCIKCRTNSVPFKKEARLVLNDALTTYPSLCTDKYVNAVANAVCIVSDTDCARTNKKRKRNRTKQQLASPPSTSALTTPSNSPNDNTVILRFNSSTDSDLDTDTDDQTPSSSQPDRLQSESVQPDEQLSQLPDDAPHSPSSVDLDDERPLSELVGRANRRLRNSLQKVDKTRHLIHMSPKLKLKAQRQKRLRLAQQQKERKSHARSGAKAKERANGKTKTPNAQGPNQPSERIENGEPSAATAGGDEGRDMLLAVSKPVETTAVKKVIQSNSASPIVPCNEMQEMQEQQDASPRGYSERPNSSSVKQESELVGENKVEDSDMSQHEDDMPLGKQLQNRRKQRISPPPKKAHRMKMAPPTPSLQLSVVSPKPSPVQQGSPIELKAQPIQPRPSGHSSPSLQPSLAVHSQSTPIVDDDQRKAVDQPVAQPEDRKTSPKLASPEEDNDPTTVEQGPPAVSRKTSGSSNAAADATKKWGVLDPKREALLTLAFSTIRAKPGESHSRLSTSIDGEAGARSKLTSRTSNVPESERQRIAMAASHSRDLTSLRMRESSSSLPSLSRAGPSASLDRLRVEENQPAHKSMDESRLSRQLTGGSVSSIDVERRGLPAHSVRGLIRPAQEDQLPRNHVGVMRLNTEARKEPLAPLRGAGTGILDDPKLPTARPSYSNSPVISWGSRGGPNIRERDDATPIPFDMPFSKIRSSKSTVNSIPQSPLHRPTSTQRQQLPHEIMAVKPEANQRTILERSQMAPHAREIPHDPSSSFPRPHVPELPSQNVFNSPFSAAADRNSFISNDARQNNNTLPSPSRMSAGLWRSQISEGSPQRPIFTSGMSERGSGMRISEGQLPRPTVTSGGTTTNWPYSLQDYGARAQESAARHDFGELYPSIPPPIGRRPKRLVPYVSTATRKALYEQGRALAFAESSSNPLGFDGESRLMDRGRTVSAPITRVADGYDRRDVTYSGRRDYALPEVGRESDDLFTTSGTRRYESGRFGSEVPQAIREPLRPPTAMSAMNAPIDGLNRQRSISQMVGSAGRKSVYDMKDSGRGRQDFRDTGGHPSNLQVGDRRKDGMFPALHPPLNLQGSGMRTHNGSSLSDVGQRRDSHRLDNGSTYGIGGRGFNAERPLSQRELSSMPLVARFDSIGAFRDGGAERSDSSYGRAQGESDARRSSSSLRHLLS